MTYTERMIWRMLDHRARTTTELEHDTGLPRHRIQRILGGMRKRGLVMSESLPVGRGRMWTVVRGEGGMP